MSDKKDPVESIKEYGKNLQRLGAILQDPDSTMEEIVRASSAVGLRIAFEVVWDGKEK